MATGSNWSEAIRQKDFGIIADWFTIYFFSAGLTGLFAASVAAYLDTNQIAAGVRVAAVGLLFAGACTVCGWLLGLLFGIPRSLARGNVGTPTTGATPAPAGNQAQISRVNTNLEDVSDWLTKTIIGVGLTQIVQLPRFIHHVAGVTNAQGLGWPNYGTGLALVIFFYYAPGGFWLGYVGTRTILTKLFDLIDSGLADSDLTKAAQINLSDGGIAPAPQDIKKIDAALLEIPVQNLTSVKEVSAWAAAKARNGDLQAARVALEDALKTEPENDDVRKQLATVYAALGQFDSANSLLANDFSTPTAVLAALYELPPKGYEKAIKIGEKLLKKSAYEKNASLHVWLACAYAQKYGHDKSTGKNELLEADRARVIAEAGTAIRIQPTTREQLYSFWRPAAGSIDDDLSFLDPDDSELKALLSPPSTPPSPAPPEPLAPPAATN